jgi:hypothetical protein
MIKYFEFRAVPVDPSKYDNNAIVEGSFACPLTIFEPEKYLRDVLDKRGLRLEAIHLDHELLIEPLQARRPQLLEALRHEGHWLEIVVSEKELGP